MFIRVEKHLIKGSDELDRLCFISKNVYNAANYIVRSEFIRTSKLKEEGLVEHATYLGFYDIVKLIKGCRDYEEYKELPAKVLQQVLRLLDKNWKSFFKSIKVWSKNKSGYKGQPRPPKYLDKQGRNLLIFPDQGVGLKESSNGELNLIKLYKTKVAIKTKVSKESLLQVRVIPKGNKCFEIEVVYKKEIENLNLNKKNVIGIDIGLNNLLAIASNQPESLCCLVNGRPIKSINQYYNKNVASITSTLKIVNSKDWSRKLSRMALKRKNKIDDYLHKASKEVIQQCKEFNIGRIIIGHNDLWKQDINIGKKNNQNFVQVPFNRIIQMIKYKAEEVGIVVEEVEESYTSKCDHLAFEEMKHQENYLGKRTKRGMFVSSTGVSLNSDLNGALGILRKAKNVACEEFLGTLASRGCVLQPIKLNF